MAIYVNFERPRTVKEFLNTFYQEDVYDSYKLVASETYKDKECTILQCNRNRIRSYDDLYELVKTYYPSYTRKKLTLLLIKSNFNNKIIGGYFGSCRDMNKIRYIPIIKYGVYNPEFKNKYSLICNTMKLKSKYGWKELFSKVGINSQEDFDKIRNKKKGV